MDCIKGMMAGLIIGVTAGAILGACNSDCLQGMLKQGTKEIKRFKRKYM